MDRQKLADAIREQARWCERLGSPLYHALLTRIAGDVDRSGQCWKVLEPHAEDPGRSLLPLRFLGAVHRLVLEGRLPVLAKYYPSAGGTADPEAAWDAFLDVLNNNADEIRGTIPQKLQTNEVTRCCALLPGFLEVARATGLPLRLLEIGCSAGLNLRWDHYRYRDSQSSWGPADSPVVFDNVFAGDASVDVVERRGCDLNPLDPTTDDGRLTLLSFVWPDQTDRLRQLSNAIEVARSVPAPLDRADAIEWLETELKEPRPGVATVVFHSIVLLYMSNDGRERIRQLLAHAGERASAEAPLAWLSMEPGEAEADVHLTTWPGGERRLIARSGYHGLGVEIEPRHGEQAGRPILQ
jgi:hypothetical protein